MSFTRNRQELTITATISSLSRFTWSKNCPRNHSPKYDPRACIFYSLLILWVNYIVAWLLPFQFNFLTVPLIRWSKLPGDISLFVNSGDILSYSHRDLYSMSTVISIKKKKVKTISCDTKPSTGEFRRLSSPSTPTGDHPGVVLTTRRFYGYGQTRARSFSLRNLVTTAPLRQLIPDMSLRSQSWKNSSLSKRRPQRRRRDQDRRLSYSLSNPRRQNRQAKMEATRMNRQAMKTGKSR